MGRAKRTSPMKLSKRRPMPIHSPTHRRKVNDTSGSERIQSYRAESPVPIRFILTSQTQTQTPLPDMARPSPPYIVEWI